jgi:hypothetical protein
MDIGLIAGVGGGVLLLMTGLCGLAWKWRRRKASPSSWGLELRHVQGLNRGKCCVPSVCLNEQHEETKERDHSEKCEMSATSSIGNNWRDWYTCICFLYLLNVYSSCV